MELKTNEQIELARSFIESCGVHIFLTGKAGTGKTTFLREICKTLNKRVVIAAPTGVAALNAGGVTLHSLFQLPFGPYIERGQSKKVGFTHKLSSKKIALIRSIELLVIDEISMVRSDILDSVNETLRRVRRNNRPFGGVQLLMIGDIGQLSPICRDEEWQILKDHYKTPYFFDSNTLKGCDYITIELKEIFRQSDTSFTTILNAIRENNITSEQIAKLNERYIEGFTPSESEKYITLAVHNNTANYINSSKLENLDTKSTIYKAKISGDFPENIYPNEVELEIKIGAQVMFTKNDTSAQKLFYNGLIGTVTNATNDKVFVKPSSGGEVIEVRDMQWDNIEYGIDSESSEITENIKGSFSQMPLKCAWAITIHKSQGLSFEKAIIDTSGAFAHGQVYVALSRCRSLEGLVLRAPLNRTSIIHDNTVTDFSNYVLQNQPNNDQLEHYKKLYFSDIISEIFSFEPLKTRVRILSSTLNNNLLNEYPLLCNSLQKLNFSLIDEVFEVGKRFIVQLSRLIGQTNDYATNPAIRERLQKSAGYFTSKIEPLRAIIKEISSLNFDNKVVKKQIDRICGEIREDIDLFFTTMELCGGNFSIDQYQKRKMATLTKGLTTSKEKKKQSQQKVKEPKTEVSISSDLINKNLYNILSQWRLAEATSTNKPAFAVLSNKILIQLQAILPLSIEELLEIQGVGPKIAANYGYEILEIIIDYCSENNIDPKSDEYREKLEKIIFAGNNSKEEKAPIKKEENAASEDEDGVKIKEENVPTKEKVKIPTTTQTFELIKRGLNIEEIAKERNLACSTIYSHITNLIKSKNLSLTDYVSEEKQQKIRSTFTTQSPNPKEIKEILGNEFEMWEIYMVTKLIENSEENL